MKETENGVKKTITIHLIIFLLFYIGMFAYSQLRFGSYDSISLLILTALYILIHTLTALTLGIIFAIKKRKSLAIANFICSAIILVVGFGACYLVGNIR